MSRPPSPDIFTAAYILCWRCHSGVGFLSYFTVYSPLLLYTVLFLRHMLVFYSNLCIVHFFVSINDDDDDDEINYV